MNYFYDAQFKSVLSQFGRIFSNFSYLTGVNHTGQKELLPIPCKYGATSRMVNWINRKNSENTALTIPFISYWISSLDIARDRTKNPTHISQLNVTEREFDYENRKYTNNPGNKVTIDRLTPVPYNVTMQVDIWTSNEEMKFQILEQILILFNPSIDFQKNTNPFDWTSLDTIELTSINYSSRNIPVGTEDAIDVTTLTFALKNFYLNPPAKVKRQKLIKDVIIEGNTNTEELSWNRDDFFQSLETPLKYEIRIEDDVATLITDQDISWKELFLQLRLNLHNESNRPYMAIRPSYDIEFVNANVLLDLIDYDNNDPKKLFVKVNINSLPDASLSPVNDVINPNVVYPNNGLIEQAGFRYLITNNIIPNTIAWGALEAPEGSIIETNDGVNWFVAFDPTQNDPGEIVLNSDNGQLLVLINSDTWIDVYQGTYLPGYWTIIEPVFQPEYIE